MAVVLGCLLEVDGKPLLLKIPHTGYRARIVGARSTLKASFLWSSFHDARGTVQAAQGRGSLTVLPTREAPTQAWQATHKGEVSATHMSAVVTSSLPNWTESPPNGRET